MKDEEMKRLQTLIAATSKNVLTPNEVCVVYSLSLDQLANAVERMEILAKRGRDGKVYFRRGEVESYFTLGSEIEMEDLPTIAEIIRSIAVDQKI
jgi:hypothetical protein